jgi:hypothetical protein
LIDIQKLEKRLLQTKSDKIEVVYNTTRQERSEIKRPLEVPHKKIHKASKILSKGPFLDIVYGRS